MVPSTVPSDYIERDSISKDLERSCLRSEYPKGENKCYVLYGIGGSGKTLVCRKFAQDHRER